MSHVFSFFIWKLLGGDETPWMREPRSRPLVVVQRNSCVERTCARPALSSRDKSPPFFQLCWFSIAGFSQTLLRSCCVSFVIASQLLNSSPKSCSLRSCVPDLWVILCPFHVLWYLLPWFWSWLAALFALLFTIALLRLFLSTSTSFSSTQPVVRFSMETCHCWGVSYFSEVENPILWCLLYYILWIPFFDV